MLHHLEENIHSITPEFIAQRIPTRQRDRDLYDTYCKALDKGETRLPVFEGTEGTTDDYPALTHYGFAMLSIDQLYMTQFFRPAIQQMRERVSSMTSDELHLYRASLLEFALLGCKEAQSILYCLPMGGDEDYVTRVVEKRWPNLQRLGRFLTAQNLGAVPFTDEPLPTYAEALAEVRAGCKRKHWIWYIFPQMYGIAGTHSQMSLYFGIRGRMEATQYICHPVLRRRLVEICEAVRLSGKSIYEIFPEVDAMKVRSCLQLFSSVSDIEVLKQIR